MMNVQSLTYEKGEPDCMKGLCDVQDRRLMCHTLKNEKDHSVSSLMTKKWLQNDSVGVLTLDVQAMSQSMSGKSWSWTSNWVPAEEKEQRNCGGEILLSGGETWGSLRWLGGNTGCLARRCETMRTTSICKSGCHQLCGENYLLALWSWWCWGLIDMPHDTRSGRRVTAGAAGDGHLFTGITGVDKQRPPLQVVASSGCGVGIEWWFSSLRNQWSHRPNDLSLFMLSPEPLFFLLCCMLMMGWSGGSTGKTVGWAAVHVTDVFMWSVVLPFRSWFGCETVVTVLLTFSHLAPRRFLWIPVVSLLCESSMYWLVEGKSLVVIISCIWKDFSPLFFFVRVTLLLWLH